MLRSYHRRQRRATHSQSQRLRSRNSRSRRIHKSVDFPLGFNELSFFNADNRAVVEPARYIVWIGGSSTADQSVAFRTTAMARPQ